MEKVNRTPIIIEFFGLPGSGKTTIADALQKAMNELGKTTCRHYFRTSLFKSTRFLYLMPQFWNCIKEGTEYASLLSKRINMARVLTIAHFNRMYRAFTKDHPTDILITDQGIIQAIVSLGHNDLLPKSDKIFNLFDSLRLNDLNIVFINCHVSKNISNERIIHRPSNGCRVEKMHEEERKKTLEVQEQNFDFIREAAMERYQKINFLDINSEASVDISVKKIISSIFDSD